jgi:hypothetical protein
MMSITQPSLETRGIARPPGRSGLSKPVHERYNSRQILLIAEEENSYFHETLSQAGIDG